MTGRPDTGKIPAIVIHDENEQVGRMRRLVIAFSGYVLAFLCAAFPAHLMGFSRGVNWPGIFLFQALPFVAFYACLFILIYTGINRRFRDPGLIFVQQFVGISVYQTGDSIDTLVARADAALYDAKRNGKNRVEFRAHA